MATHTLDDVKALIAIRLNAALENSRWYSALATAALAGVLSWLDSGSLGLVEWSAAALLAASVLACVCSVAQSPTDRFLVAQSIDGLPADKVDAFMGLLRTRRWWSERLSTIGLMSFLLGAAMAAVALLLKP